LNVVPVSPLWQPLQVFSENARRVFSGIGAPGFQTKDGVGASVFPPWKALLSNLSGTTWVICGANCCR
jgi:hypothetical protein